MPVKVDHDSIEKCKEFVRNNPDDAQAHLYLGVAYYHSCMREESIEPYKHVLRIDPDNKQAHLFLGFTYRNLGDRDSVLKEHGILKRLGYKVVNLPSRSLDGVEFKGE